MLYKKLIPVNVRHVLAATPVGKYALFQIQPEIWAADRWQGGESFHVKRMGENEFLCVLGERPYKTIEEAARFIEEKLRRYNAPFIGSEP